MKASGPKAEHEVIIRFDDESPDTEIYTASDIVDRRCRKAGLTLIEAGERHNVYTCPKAAIKIRGKIQRKPMSAEKRARLVERMAVARAGLKKT